MRSRIALLLVFLLLATAALAIIGQAASDPLAPYRAPDGSLHIPGGALTPELQRLIFGGNDAQPYFNLSYYGPARSSYPTMGFVERSYLVPNPSVVTHPLREPETIAGGMAHLLSRWFPPFDWAAQLHAAAGWFFGLFTWNARAAVNIDTATVTDATAAVNTCTTSQTTGATDNAVLVLLSERGTTTFLSVTYGSTSLTLVTNTGANGGTLVRTEIWAFNGTLPPGLQTMTATLSGGATARMTCATILLQNVKAFGSFINGTSNSAATTNATITLGATVAVGNLAFAVAALQNAGGGVQPTAVAGTGATATDLYGVTTGHCSGAGASNECAAGADIPNPGTAITWTNPATSWVVSAVEVVAIPLCGTVGGGNCYRIGNNGGWNSATNWSNTPGGASCGCTPTASDFAVFNGSPTGTTSLSAATTIAGIDMTGFTGSLDTTNANSWSLTVNGNFTIQGAFLARGSTVVVTGNVTIVGATTAVTLSTSTWTVNGTWTNNSTSATWSAGTGSVTIKDALSGTLTFGNLGVNEFNNLTLDASAAAGLTYTMATNGLRMGGTVTVQNSTAGATGSVILDTSASNLSITAGALTIGTLGATNTEASTIIVNGNATVSNSNSYVTNTGGSWTVTGVWSDASTSVAWSFAATMSFRSTVSRTMTFGPQAGNEFASNVTFDTTVTTAVTYTMATNALDVGGTITIQNSAAGASGTVTLDTSAGNLAITSGALTLSTLGAFNTRASTITVSGAVNVSAGNAYVTNTGGSWAVAGAWTDRTTSASWAFVAAVTFRAAASQAMIFTGSNLASNEFGGAVTFDTTATGGITYTMAAGATGDSSLRIGGALTLRNSAAGATAATVLDTSAGNYNITAASLTLGNPRGALNSEGSVITINGAVTLSDANSYLVLGSALWTVTGAWTNGSTDSADWAAGTGSVTFRSAASATMTFANLGVNEANNVTFDTSTAAGITYTMSTNGLRIAGTLTVQNTAATPTGNTVLTTSASNLGLGAGGVVVGARGTLTANGSTVTVNGSWTSTAANHVWNRGTSTVIFGATGTLTTSASDSFNILTQAAGTTTLGSNVTVAGATTVSGSLDTSISSYGLTLQSSMSVGAAGVLNLEASTVSTTGNVSIAAGGAVRFTGAATWTITGTWTDANALVPASWAVGTATVRIVDAAATTLTFWTATGSEFYNLVLDASIAAGFTYTQTNALQTGGTLTVQNTAAGASGAVVLDATASNYASTLGGLAVGTLGAYASRNATVLVSGNVSVAASGYVTSTATGAWSATGSWTDNTTSASWSFLAPITFRSATNQVMTFKSTATEFGGNVTFDTANAAGVTYTMATNALTLSGLLTVRNSVASPTGNTILDTSPANLGVTAASVTLGTNGTLLAEGSAISVGGNWTVTAANATFTAGASTVAFTAAGTINMTQPFNNLSMAAGATTLASNLTVSGALSVAGGILAKGTNTMTLNAVTLSGGAITSTSGNVSIAGNVNISSAASYIAFGTETWTVSGSWTNASTSASWSIGTATLLFNSSGSPTMTFMTGSGNEFYNLTLNAGSSNSTFTMATNGLRIANALTVQGGTGATMLSTSASNLPIAAVSLTVGSGGVLVANGSTITVKSMDTSNGSFTPGTSTLVVNASGGAINVPQTVNNLTVSAGVSTTFTGNLSFSGTLTLTSSTPTFNGNLTSSGAATVTFASATIGMAGSWTTTSAANFTSTSSTVTFTGSAKTVALAAAQSFATVSISGSVSQLSQLTTTGLSVSAGSLTKGTNSLTVNGNLTLSGGALLSTSGSVTVSGNVSVSAAASYIQFGSEAWTVSGSWTNASTSASWSTGTGTVTFNSASNQTMTFAGANLSVAEFNNVVFDTTAPAGVTYTMATRGLSVSGNLTIRNTAPGPTGNTLLTTSASNLAITSGGTVSTTATGTLTANGSTIAFASFDTFAGTFNAGTSNLVAATTNGSISASQALHNLTVGAGVTLSAASNLTVSGLLTVNGVFATLASNLTVATLASLAGGITGASGTKAFGGSITINASGYFGFGAASWTFGGTWTDNSTSASWSPGTATVTFDSTTGGTMTFAALPGNAPEFEDVVFNGGSSTVTFAMATNALAWAGALTLQGGSGTTSFATNGLGLTGGSIVVGNAGVLTANASAVSVDNVAMTGGASGTIAITTGAWTVRGSWNTSGAGSALSAGSSTVVFTGVGATIAMSGGQAFSNLTIGGSVALGSAVTASATLTVNAGATLTKTGQSITFNTLVENGTGSIADGSVGVANFSVTNTDATNLTTISVFSRWTIDSEFTWTDASTVGTSTLTFTIGGNSLGGRFNVSKDGVAFSSGLVDGSGQVVFTMLGSDPVVDVVVAAPCGSTRYWTGGAGNWSQSAHWASTSGGPGGCSVPNGTMAVVLDANSGVNTVTLDQDASLASLSTTGFTGTLAAGTFNLAVGGNLIHAGGTITIGASSANGLTVAGTLTLSGSAVLDGSGAASVVSVTGDTSITSSTAYMRMGSGTWTFGGAWSNSSTAASWSPGTGTVVFESASSRTMMFANLGTSEFFNLTIASTAASGSIVFTMGTNALRWSGVLTIQDSTGSTTTLATANLALAGGSLAIGNSGLLLANASSVSVSDVTMSGGTSGTITVTSGAWTVSGNWDTSGAGSAFTKGTGSLTMSGTARTLKVLNASNGFYNLVVSGTVTQSSAIDVNGTLSITGALTTAGNSITGGPGLMILGGGTLSGTSSSLSVSGVTMNDAAANTLSLTTGSLTVSGSWDTSGTASLLNVGTSAVSLSAASGTIALGASQSFAALTISGDYGLTTPLSASSLTLVAGTLAKGANAFTVNGDVVLSGGSLTSTSGDVTVAGSIDVSAAASYIAFGSETWTVSGSWTNASTSANWSAGTGTIVFNAASDQTMTFAGTNLPGPEFSAVLFNGGSSTVTFTMAGSALLAHTIAIQGGSATTSLDTSASNLAITADTLIVAAGGALLANGSILTVRAIDTFAGSFVASLSTILVNASGGTIRIPQTVRNLTVNPGITTTFATNLTWSAALTLTGASVTFQGNLTSTGPSGLSFGSAALAVAGSWDTSSAITFTSSGSSVTFTGMGQTVTLATGQAFATLAIAGSIGLGSDLTAAVLAVNAAGTLTMTNHTIAFNGLAVNGTVVDGSVNVTGLTVTNSDATALVTISVFTAWNPGSEYAWTHSSSEASQTVTWTIGGNTSRFLYHVTKNGSSFADGTVDNSGNVVFTMLGSDPDMVVTVSAPPVPAWWQSTYFFALPPIAFLMVVAMFVQRRRWRPAKAFLVDERGQLLREFTLDPSCGVTYDQARQAGALDAVDKDVRVSKYHARAVRGDMLSLVMLAVGPADIEEVEFARGMLVSIQDKLEDRVKQRVEEARAEESTLESARAQEDEERADLQARARVFGDMVNAFTIARTKMDADSKKLHKFDENLRTREERVAADRTDLEERASKLQAYQDSLDHDAADLTALRTSLQETEQSLADRESNLGPREEDLTKRTANLSRKESEIAEREETLTAAEAKLTANVKDYRAKAGQMAKLESELAEERKSLDELTVRVDQDTVALKERTSSIEAREQENASAAEALQARAGEMDSREESLRSSETEIASRETALAQKEETLAAREKEVAAQLDDLRSREATLGDRTRELAEERKALDGLTNDAIAERKALDAKAAALAEQEQDVAKKTQDLQDLKGNLGPREAAIFQKETDLVAREKVLAEERTTVQGQQDLVAAKALEIQQQIETLKERENGIAQEKLILQDAKDAFEAEHKELDAKKAAFAAEAERRETELVAEERTLGEARMQLTRDRETFEAQRAEKGQWIASKEIELEAREQSLTDREAEIRAQAEDNGRQLSELAAREEALEIESSKQDKTRIEFETRKAELGAIGRDLETRVAKFQDEEARKAEELRTWQTTLESEQALLKEQRETFEKEMLDLRESWAGRMIRVEQREEELKEREGKVQTDVEWVARNESDLSKREKAAAENLRAANELKAEGERLRQDLEQRALEVESHERSLREEAADQSIELEKRAEALQAQETELAGRKAQSERELTTQTQKLKDREAELTARRGEVDDHEADLVSREAVIVNQQSALRQDEDRLARERIDLQAMEKQLESKQLELGQAREQLDAESLRLRTETDAVRQSLAAKEADLLSERERLERESSALQEKLGSKAKEMASREKGVSAREVELRAEEQDLEARMREIDSRERQTQARLPEIAARESALAAGEQEQKARRSQFDESVQKFEIEAASRQKEWQDLQATLKSQEAQLAASAETRHAEIQRRMEDLEQREHSLNATLTQAQIERTRLEAQAKGHATKQAEIEAAVGRADTRFAELKTMEEELLKSRQAFESEKAGWSARRSEELKQLEATRDAAAEQTQQSERLIEDAQRRAYVAVEAEKAAKRQMDELTAAQATLEQRRAEAEKAEKDLQAQMAQLREATQRLGTKEVELGSRSKELEAAQARLAEAEKKGLETGESLKGRKAALDQEAERIASVAAELDRRQAEDATRHAAIETKLGDVTKREQVLSTELQRADNLMEDLNRKEAAIVAREKDAAGRAGALTKQEQMLARRDAELAEGMQTLERLRREHETLATQSEADHRIAAEARKEAEGIRSDSEKLRAQADAMQAEVSKNMRFLQKKALDVLDREEKIRAREVKMDEESRVLESRAQILEQKDRAVEAEKAELTARVDKAKQDNDKLRAKLAEVEKSSKSTIDMDEWKRDIENRVKIIQKKALDLLDREEKLRKKEDELKALAAQLGVEAKS